MVRADVLTLIAETPDAHGVFDTFTETERTVFCTVRSASYNDILTAGGQGLRPEIVFRLPHDFEYQGEKLCEYRGTQYNVDRVYFSDNDWLDLTCSRRHLDVRDAAAAAEGD